MANRLHVISRQLCSNVEAPSPPDVKTDILSDFLVHDNKALRDRIASFLKDEIFRPNHYLGLMEFRELTMQRLKMFVAQGFFTAGDYKEDPRRFMACLEALTFCDYSLAIKAGVHFTLCGGVICKLGTQKHHTKYLPLLSNLTLPGSFGMTEMGHGSNVMGIETTATYDAQSKQFIVNTPNDQASKYWIGGTAQHGKLCAVFAQLTVNGKWEGPHVFLVRIRDDEGGIMPGVRITDNGPKAGLNGVDNGRLWFNNVRVPRDDMLDAFAQVDDHGNYHSRIPSISQRFGAVVGGLTTGRILLAQGAIDACKMGLTIAIRYAVDRPQFGNTPIVTYITHQRRLFPALATTYALHLQMKRVKDIAVRGSPKEAKLLHIMSSGVKAAATWHKVSILQDCRECCGGFGFQASNKIGPLKNDMDVDVTFEGDNTVLMQQVAKVLIEEAASGKAVASGSPSAGFRSAGQACERQVLRLLRYRQEALTGQVAAAVRSSGQAGFDSNLDVAVALGWAYVDHISFENLLGEAASAPASIRASLSYVAILYGLSRLEACTAFFLAEGVLTREDVVDLRTLINTICGQMAANGADVALRLCDAFGIPDHLLEAPIATVGWRNAP